MTIKYLSSETERLQNQTINGIDICSTLIGKSAFGANVLTTNEYLADSPKYLDPSYIHIKVTLKRDNKEHLLISENLALLGRYATITQGREQWENGIRRAGNEDLHAVFIPFSGNTNFPSHINLKGDDELITYVNVTRGAYGDLLDANACILDVRATPSIGIETHIPFISSYGIRKSQAKDTIQAGNNVMRIALLSMMDTPTKTPSAFTDVSINSDRLDISFTSNQLILAHSKSIEDSVRSHANNVDTYLIHEDTEIDNCKISLKMNPQFIEENCNYVMYSHFVSSIDIIQKAAAMVQKHQSADLGKLEATI